MEDQLGKRFSHLYLSRGVPENDSKVARFRLAKLCEKAFPTSTYSNGRSTFNYKKAAIDAIESEIGIEFSSRSSSGSLHEIWEWYFNRITVFQLLDTITVLANMLGRRVGGSDSKKNFLNRAQRIFSEENLCYRIELDGSIHPLIDSAFTKSIESAISLLGGPRYVATAAHVSAIDDYLMQEFPDYKAAIRSIFNANENLFKLMYNEIRLDAKSAGDNISRALQAKYDGHSNQQASSAKMLDGFKNWINAAHFYRHEEGAEEPNQPCEELAILIISQGISYVRWLVQIDTQRVNDE